MWIVIAGVLVVISVTKYLDGGGSSALGALFRKYTIRRVSLGGKVKAIKSSKGDKDGRTHKRGWTWSSMTMAQLAGVTGILLLASLASTIGDDFISPFECLFGGVCPYQGVKDVNGGPPRSTFAPNSRIVKKDLVGTDAPPLPLPAFLPVSPSSMSDGSTSTIQRRAGVNNPNMWAPFNDPLLAGPNVAISKNWWTASNRLGLIAVALLPLCVSFALKQVSSTHFW
jgi:hypothetical protein